jgi:hypothetical protein
MRFLLIFMARSSTVGGRRQLDQANPRQMFFPPFILFPGNGKILANAAE